MGAYFKYLVDEADSDNKNANKDYNGSAAEFTFTATENTKLERMIVYVEDAGGFDAGAYGNSVVLTNGISVEVVTHDGTQHIDLTDGLPIKTNAHWSRLCYDVNYIDYGTGNNAIAVRWTFAKSGAPLYLPIGYKLVVNVSDTLTGLVDHTFMVQGVS